MHPAYFETRFRVQNPCQPWPESFAILSAYATTGSAWTAERNREAARSGLTIFWYDADLDHDAKETDLCHRQ